MATAKHGIIALQQIQEFIGGAIRNDDCRTDRGEAAQEGSALFALREQPVADGLQLIGVVEGGYAWPLNVGVFIMWQSHFQWDA